VFIFGYIREEARDAWPLSLLHENIAVIAILADCREDYGRASGSEKAGPDAITAAQGYLYQQFQHQVTLLSFMDCFRVIAWLTLAAVPLLLFIRRFTPAGKSPAAH
jgi:hypothetical protein